MVVGTIMVKTDFSRCPVVLKLTLQDYPSRVGLMLSFLSILIDSVSMARLRFLLKISDDSLGC